MKFDLFSWLNKPDENKDDEFEKAFAETRRTCNCGARTNRALKKAYSLARPIYDRQVEEIKQLREALQELLKNQNQET